MVTEKRMSFRRKKERQFIRGIVGGQVIIVLCFLLGVGFSIRNLRIEYERHLTLNDRIHVEVEAARRDIQELLAQQEKGHRFTAGNSWQMAQLVLHGRVDMADFPDYDLKYPDETWFHGWLYGNNLFVVD